MKKQNTVNKERINGDIESGRIYIRGQWYPVLMPPEAREQGMKSLVEPLHCDSATDMESLSGYAADMRRAGCKWAVVAMQMSPVWNQHNRAVVVEVWRAGITLAAAFERKQNEEALRRLRSRARFFFGELHA